MRRVFLVLAASLLLAVSAISAVNPTRTTGVERKTVRFESQGIAMVGVLYVPRDGRSKHAGVVIAPPWLNVKEQVAANYGQALAERGITALAFDFRHWGESGGTPREFESPEHKVQDLKAAVAFLRARPEIESQQVGVLGICFGAGYAAQAASEDPNVRSVATVAAWLHDAASLKATFGDAEIARRYRVGRAAAEQVRKGGAAEYVLASSATDREAAMLGADYYLEPNRGVVKQWTNRMAVMSWVGWLDFDAVALGSRVQKPLLMVHSDGSALPDNVRKFFASVAGPKDLFWTQGNHMDFYDREPYVEKAADAVATHFRRTLK